MVELEAGDVGEYCPVALADVVLKHEVVNSVLDPVQCCLLYLVHWRKCRAMTTARGNCAQLNVLSVIMK